MAQDHLYHTFCYRSTILLDSKSLLRGRAVSDQAIAEALVSTMLLEDSSPRQALADFLLARKASIQQLLNQPQHGAHSVGFCSLWGGGFMLMLTVADQLDWMGSFAESTYFTH